MAAADTEAGESTLAQAIIDLGASFELRVVAEGIEHESQVQRLLAMGCRFGQGFHFAKPTTAAEFECLLAREGAIASWPENPRSSPPLSGATSGLALAASRAAGRA